MKSKQNSGFLTELYPGFDMLFSVAFVVKTTAGISKSVLPNAFLSRLFLAERPAEPRGWVSTDWIVLVKNQTLWCDFYFFYLFIFNSESQSVRRLQGVLQSFLPIFYFKVNVAAERPHPLLQGKAYRRPLLSWLVRDTQAYWLPSGGVSVKNTWRE